MEPLHIKLKDFTSYHDAEIDLTGVTLAALVGPNGAGKSSVIDAMLFVLYGQSSKGGKQEKDAHVRPGADACRIEMVFRLGGADYRVIRIRDRRRQKSALELFQADGTPMSGKNIDETQEKIDGLLRMDYDSITASALILQGQSGNLTGTMTDGDRRKVFDRILGLDLYEVLEAMAKERKAQADAEVNLIRQEAGDAEDLARVYAVVTDHAAGTERRLQEADGEVAGAQDKIAECEAQARQLPILQQQRLDVEDQIRDRRQEEDRLLAERRAGFSEALRLQGTLGRPDTVRHSLNSAQQALVLTQETIKLATDLVADTEAKAQMEATLADQIKDLDQQVAQKTRDREQIGEDGRKAKTALDREKNILDRALEIRAAAYKATELSAQVEVWDERAAEHEAATVKQRTMQDAFMEWKTRLDGRIRIHESTLAACRRQAEVLDAVPCGDDLRPVCPLLANGIQAAALITQTEIELAGLQAETFSGQPELTWIANVLKSIAYDAGAHRSARMELAQLQQAAGLLPALEAAEVRATDLKVQVADYAARWRALDAELQDLQARGATAAGNLFSVVGSGAALAQAKLQLQTAQTVVQRYTTEVARLEQALTDADRQETETQARIQKITDREQTDLNPRIAQVQQWMTALKEKWNGLDGQIAQADGVQRSLEGARTALVELKATQALIRTELSALQAEAAALKLAIQKAESMGDRLQEALVRSLVYAVLIRACSKKGGIPALIRENAVPQVEGIANGLLGRMAGGRLQLRLDTQAASKNQETLQEVLRVTVLDQGDARDYKTFSGAERFMVDLALRMALSRFLANRAGAEIQTFVLDEGLGSLDAANRQEVMAALNAAATEFRKVLVITHIPELQESLPQRIEFRRTEAGSKVQVIV